MMDGESDYDKMLRFKKENKTLKKHSAFKNGLIICLCSITIILYVLIDFIGGINKSTKAMLESRQETIYLHSNISSDSVLIWVSDSTQVYKRKERNE